MKPELLFKFPNSRCDWDEFFGSEGTHACTIHLLVLVYYSTRTATSRMLILRHPDYSIGSDFYTVFMRDPDSGSYLRYIKKDINKLKQLK